MVLEELLPVIVTFMTDNNTIWTFVKTLATIDDTIAHQLFELALSIRRGQRTRVPFEQYENDAAQDYVLYKALVKARTTEEEFSDTS